MIYTRSFTAPLKKGKAVFKADTQVALSDVYRLDISDGSIVEVLSVEKCRQLLQHDQKCGVVQVGDRIAELRIEYEADNTRLSTRSTWIETGPSLRRELVNGVSRNKKLVGVHFARDPYMVSRHEPTFFDKLATENFSPVKMAKLRAFIPSWDELKDGLEGLQIGISKIWDKDMGSDSAGVGVVSATTGFGNPGQEPMLRVQFTNDRNSGQELSLPMAAGEGSAGAAEANAEPTRVRAAAISEDARADGRVQEVTSSETQVLSNSGRREVEIPHFAMLRPDIERNSAESAETVGRYELTFERGDYVRY